MASPTLSIPACGGVTPNWQTQSSPPTIAEVATCAGPKGVANGVVSNPGPVGPVAPVLPVGPVGPVGPVAPAPPVAPVGPVAPVAPVGPVGPVGPLPPLPPALRLYC